MGQRIVEEHVLKISLACGLVQSAIKAQKTQEKTLTFPQLPTECTQKTCTGRELTLRVIRKGANSMRNNCMN